MKLGSIVAIIALVAALIAVSFFGIRYTYERGRIAGQLETENAALRDVAAARDRADAAERERDTAFQQSQEQAKKEIADAQYANDQRIKTILARFPRTLPLAPAQPGEPVPCALSAEYRELHTLATSPAAGD